MPFTVSFPFDVRSSTDATPFRSTETTRQSMVVPRLSCTGTDVPPTEAVAWNDMFIRYWVVWPLFRESTRAAAGRPLGEGPVGVELPPERVKW